MAKQDILSKKGPHRMASTCKPLPPEHVADHELDSDVESFVRKLHSTLQEARSKMSDEEVAKADQEAKAVLERASASAKASQRRA